MKASNPYNPLTDTGLTRWLTRGLSLVADLFYSLILIAAFTNEDAPTTAGWAVLGCVAVCILASLLAWRWPRAGGLIILAGAAALVISVIISTGIQGYDLLATLIALFVYPVPAVLVGALFVADGQFVQ